MTAAKSSRDTSSEGHHTIDPFAKSSRSHTSVGLQCPQHGDVVHGMLPSGLLRKTTTSQAISYGMFVLTFDVDPSTFRLLPIVPLPMPYQSLGTPSRNSGYAGGENGRLRLGRESFLGSVGRQRLCRIRAGTGEERGGWVSGCIVFDICFLTRPLSHSPRSSYIP